jgi:hypothetical protein
MLSVLHDLFVLIVILQHLSSPLHLRPPQSVSEVAMQSKSVKGRAVRAYCLVLWYECVERVFVCAGREENVAPLVCSSSCILLSL